METLFVLAVVATAFFLVAYVLERVGLLEEDCSCWECREARRDPFRPW